MKKLSPVPIKSICVYNDITKLDDSVCDDGNDGVDSSNNGW